MGSILNRLPQYPSIGDLMELGYSYEEASNYVRLCENEAPNPDLIWRQVRKDAPKPDGGGGG